MKKTTLPAALVSAGLLFAPLGLASDKTPVRKDMDSDMQRAIAWEHYKDVAAARQARKEALHPSVTNSSPDSSADRSQPEGRKISDPGERRVQQDKPVKK